MAMRVLFLCMLVVAGSQANFLTDIGDAFKNTFNSLVDQGKVVGGQLLDELKVTGAQMASQGLQALMLNVADALTSTDAPDTAAKRQLASGMQNSEDPNGVIYAHADELKQYMQMALNASNRLEHPENYQQPIQDFLDLIDRVVANHPASKKRAVQEALSPLKAVSGLVMSHANQLQSYMQTALAALSGLSQLVDQPQTYQNLAGFLKDVDQVVADHSTSVDAVLQKLQQEVTTLLPQAGNKRSLADSVNAIGQALNKVFQPNADVVKSMVASMGDLLKNAASQVFSSMVSSEAKLGVEELTSQHADALKMETAAVTQAGQTAVTALKQALNSVMLQTMAELKPHLTSIAGELLSAMTHQ
ncbi:uncharacterized protein LOC143289258 isoform X2 [Babylonia areolata]|uniref:uncharacterized protein LOC143289258 isoform X2 n=1 Tax=Babylonia areolata TaxID=304850 RepID=UPI003FD2AEF9